MRPIDNIVASSQKKENGNCEFAMSEDGNGNYIAILPQHYKFRLLPTDGNGGHIQVHSVEIKDGRVIINTMESSQFKTETIKPADLSNKDEQGHAVTPDGDESGDNPFEFTQTLEKVALFLKEHSSICQEPGEDTGSLQEIIIRKVTR